MLSRDNFHAGFIGIVGEPNSGKSTFFNELVGEKVSIVTHKAQTTRQRVVGIVNQENAQFVFFDAPGFINAPKGLNAFLEKEAQAIIKESDGLVVVLSLDEKKKEKITSVIATAEASGKKWIALINKTDLEQYLNRRKIIEEYIDECKNCVARFDYNRAFGKPDKDEFKKLFFEKCAQLVPKSIAPLYDVDMYTPHTERELVAEIIREKCFIELEQEIPYNLAVRVREFKEDKNLVSIRADLLVTKDGYKSMVIGKGATKIKEIGTLARKDIEKLVNNKVFLELKVAVRDNFFDNQLIMKDLGYGIVDKK